MAIPKKIQEMYGGRSDVTLIDLDETKTIERVTAGYTDSQIHHFDEDALVRMLEDAQRDVVNAQKLLNEQNERCQNAARLLARKRELK